MPAHDEHVAAAAELLGTDPAFADLVYRWQDEEYKDWFILHRAWKHDYVQTPKEADARFGNGAGDAVKLHILMDDVQTATIATQLLWLGLVGTLTVGALLAAEG